jgi:putative transposase
LTKRPSFLQDKGNNSENLINKEETMAQEKNNSKVDPVQVALLNDRDFLRRIVENFCQRLLEDEIDEHLQAHLYQRSDKRRGYRNGYKPRRLKTRVGTLELLVPQDREGAFQTELFSRYQRSEKALVASLMQMYIEGVSTRKVKDITEKLCGTSFSKSRILRDQQGVRRGDSPLA